MHPDRRSTLKAITIACCLPGCSARSNSEVNMASPVNLPRNVLQDLAWSFKEPTQASPSLFVASVRAYGESVKAPVAVAELQTRFPLNSLDIEYRYAKRIESGEWVDVPVKIRIRRSSPPTYGELLHELHSVSFETLRDQDHCYFEGLVLLDRQNESGIPVYELYLGS
jgi:hypothetical protein